MPKCYRAGTTPLSPTMRDFITVKEAARLTGKSPSSIRRIIYPIIENDQHIDRHHIQPSADEAIQLRLKGENFAWRLSEELLRREIPIVETAPHEPKEQQSTKSYEDDGLIGMLRRELDIKNAQITLHGELIGKQMELISGLSERLREGNLLIGSLQQQLAIGDGNKRSKQEIVDTTQTEQEVGESPTKTPKQGWFSRKFRS